MPKLRPLLRTDQVKYRRKLLTAQLERELHKHKIHKKEIAELIGISPAAITYQFTKESVTIETYIAVTLLIEEREKAKKAAAL